MSVLDESRTMLAFIGLPGCGLLFPGKPLNFREYPLRGVEYSDAVALVQDVIVHEFNRRFGGSFETTWDLFPEQMCGSFPPNSR